MSIQHNRGDNVASYTGSDKRLQYLFLQAGVDNCRVVSGYYHDGSFYEDQSYTQLITGSTDSLYIDLSTTTLYLFNGSTYEEVQGGGGGSTVTITPTLATGTKIADYSIDGVSDSLYAPTGGGGATDLDDLTDVTITSPTNGQALVYDSALGGWVNSHLSSGNGNVGLKLDISLGAGVSTTYSRTDLGINTKGCYLFSITSGHNAWMEYLGYFFYGGHYPGYTVSGIFSIRSSYLTVSYSDGQNGTFTIKNTSGYGENQRIEILPLHPKIDVDTNVVSGYYNNGDFYEDQSYTQIITGSEDHLYIDLNTTTLYLFDGTDYVEVKGNSGTVSDGTVGVRIAVNIPKSGSVTYSFDDLGITEYGSYWLLVNSKHAESIDGWKWIGFIQYSGYYTSSYVTSYAKALDSHYVSVSLNETAKTVTFTNNNSNWNVDHLIEVLPLHPKIEINYNEVVGILLAGTTSVTLTDIKITTSSTLEFYTDMFGLSPTNVSVSTGSITLTFEVQSVDVNVKVRIS